MSKNRKLTPNSTTTPSASVEMIAVPTAARRDSFNVGDWRSALKLAESVDNPTRVKLYDIYNDIILDTHLTSVTEKRVDAIKATKFIFDTKGKSNEAIDSLMDHSWFRQMVGNILTSRFWGYSAMWVDLSGAQFHSYKLLPRKHIIPEKGIFTIKQAERNGIDYTQPPYSSYIITAGESDDLGLLLKAVVWVLFKRGDISDWATFNELYAMPFRLAKYPQYDLAAKKELAEACRDAQSNGFAVIPGTTDLEFIQHQAASSADAYLKLAEFCDKQLSKAFLRNTMTTDAEGGQYKGDVHQTSEMQVLASDRQYVIDVLNDRFRELLELHGFNPGDGLFRCVEEDHICLKDRIEIDEKLDQIIELDAEYFHRKYGVPIPKGGAKKKIIAPVNTPPTLAMQSSIESLASQVAELVRLCVEDNEPLPSNVKSTRRSFFR